MNGQINYDGGTVMKRKVHIKLEESVSDVIKKFVEAGYTQDEIEEAVRASYDKFLKENNNLKHDLEK